MRWPGPDKRMNIRSEFSRSGTGCANKSEGALDLAERTSRSMPRNGALGGSAIRSAFSWLWTYPFLVVLVAHSVFCLGIWNARDGGNEDTVSVHGAYAILKAHRPSVSLYQDAIATVLLWLTRDPIAAITFVKYLSSLFATGALYIALNAFSSRIGKEARILACCIWMASSLDAPYLQSTSLSLFAFAIMLIAVDFILVRETAAGVFGFYVFGILAGVLRPEYYLPVGIVSIILAGRGLAFLAKMIESRCGFPRYCTIGCGICLGTIIGIVLCLNPPERIRREAGHLNRYALLGLGQCYADFYHRHHPETPLNPMTEYKEILDETFKNPTGFCEAVENNPPEAFRYFGLNSARNLLWNTPAALIDRYREQTARYHHGVLYWAVRVLLISSVITALLRIREFRAKKPGFSR